MFDVLPTPKGGGHPHGKTMGLTGKPRSIASAFPFFSADIAATVALGRRLLLRLRGYPSPTVAG